MRVAPVEVGGERWREVLRAAQAVEIELAANPLRVGCAEVGGGGVGWHGEANRQMVTGLNTIRSLYRSRKNRRQASSARTIGTAIALRSTPT